MPVAPHDQSAQKRPLSRVEAQPNPTPAKTQKTDILGFLFPQTAASIQTAPAATCVKPSHAVTRPIAPPQTNAIAASKIVGAPSSTSPQPPLPADQTPHIPAEDISDNTEVVSSEVEMAQRKKTEEDVRAYCEVIDMFDQIVKSL